MIIHNINPVLLKIGTIEIRWYGIIYALGFVIAYLWLKYMSKKGRLNMSLEELSDLLFYLIIGTVIGARLFEVFIWNPSHYFANPQDIIAFWKGGMSFHGGLFGSITALWIYTRKNKKVSFLELGDLLIIPSMIGLALGRIGNYINAELPGKITNPDKIKWCVKFPTYEGCRHPQMIYSAIGRTLSAVILLTADLKLKLKKGILLGIGFILFSAERIIVDFWREDIIYFGMTKGQWMSFPILILGILIILKNYTTKNKPKK